MNYVVLYIRLDSYIIHRAKLGDEICGSEIETSRKENVITVLFTILILSYPVGIIIFLGIFSEDFENNVIDSWADIELFYMVNFIIIAILLVSSTLMTLSHMRKVFGQ